MKLRFINKSPNPDPQYATEGDSGFDLRAWVGEDDADATYEGQPCVCLKPRERRLIHTGLYFELPKYTELQVRSRSGLSLKHGLVVANSPGTVDSNYQGEVGVIMLNISDDVVRIPHGMRIAQGVLCPVWNEYLCSLERMEAFQRETERGSGGFGHTGTD